MSKKTKDCFEAVASQKVDVRLQGLAQKLIGELKKCTTMCAGMCSSLADRLVS